jgi:hypothetical protein
MQQAFFRLVAFFLLLPFFASAGLPSIINLEDYGGRTAILTRVADREWYTQFTCKPKDVRLVVIKNPQPKNGYTAEPIPDLLCLLLKQFPCMAACNIQDFLFEDMKRFVTYLRSCQHLTTLRIANQTWDQSEMEALSALPLIALEFLNSTLSAENAAPLPKTLNVFSYQTSAWFGSQMGYNPLCATFFKYAEKLEKIYFNYPDAWINFWENVLNLQKAPIKQLHLKQPSAWGQYKGKDTRYSEYESKLGSCPTSLDSSKISKLKQIEIFSFYEYSKKTNQAGWQPKSMKGLLYTKSETQWSFFGWPDLSYSVAQSSCLDQWEGKLGELRENFSGAQFYFSDMGPKITEKLQTMQQQDGWKDKIHFKSPFSPIATISGELPACISLNFWKNPTFQGLTFRDIVERMVKYHPDTLLTPEEKKAFSEKFGLVSESQKKQWISLTFDESLLRTRAIQVIRQTLGSERSDEEMLELPYNGS